MVTPSNSPSRRLIALVVLGYGYLAGVILFVLAAVGGAVWLVWSFGSAGILVHVLWKLGIPLLGIVAVILRALWVRIPPPEGVVLAKSDAPLLFRMVEDIRQKIDAPRVHRTLVTDDLNASVAQIPRLGVFGWPINYLTIGLPLLETLSTEEIRAVLAHELGHLARSHGKFGAWIYRLRASWERLFEIMEAERRWGAGIFRRFTAWYVPKLSAESLSIARLHELAADRCSADVAGSATAATALLRIETVGAYLFERFWPEISQGVSASSEPPHGVFGLLEVAVRSGIPDDLARAAIDRATNRPTDPSDTHPSLTERLAAFGEAAVVPGPQTAWAAEALSREVLDRLHAELDGNWRREVEVAWRTRHEELATARGRCAELERTSAERALTDEERFDWASSREDAGDLPGAQSLLEVLSREAEDPRPAKLLLGRMLLGREPERAIELLEDVGGGEGHAASAAAQLLVMHFESTGDSPRRSRWRDREAELAEQIRSALSERENLRFKDEYAVSALSARQVSPLLDELRRRPEIRRAYLIRKVVRKLADQPLYVLVVRIRLPFFSFQTSGKEASIAADIASNVDLPFDFVVVPVTAENRPMETIARRLAGSEIFARDRRGREIPPRTRATGRWAALWGKMVGAFAVLIVFSSFVTPVLRSFDRPSEPERLRTLGVELSVEDRLGEAEQTLRRAVELDSTFHEARLDLALVIWKQGRFEEAVTLLRSVVEKRGDAHSWRMLGMALLYAGDSAAASEALDHALHMASENLYIAIWRSIARGRAGVSDREDLRRSVRSVGLAQWPGPIIRFFLGEIDAQALLAQARIEEAGRVERVCEAYFYAGEVARREGRVTEARHFFERSFETDVRAYVEWAAARLELSGGGLAPRS